MLINLAIGLPTMLLCLALQAAFTFWSVRYYSSQSTAMPVIRDRSRRSARSWS